MPHTILIQYNTIIIYNYSTRDNLIEQSIQFCGMQAANNVIYSEVRYCPHFLTERGGLTPEEALLAVIDGLEQGQRQHKVKVRSILSFLRQLPG